MIIVMKYIDPHFPNKDADLTKTSEERGDFTEKVRVPHSRLSGQGREKEIKDPVDTIVDSMGDMIEKTDDTEKKVDEMILGGDHPHHRKNARKNGSKMSEISSRRSMMSGICGSQKVTMKIVKSHLLARNHACAIYVNCSATMMTRSVTRSATS